MYQRSSWSPDGPTWEKVSMALWRSSVTLISWIHTPTQSICSAGGTAGRSKPFTLTKPGLSWCRKGWMGPDVSSGRGMLPKQGSFPGRNSAGLWTAFPSTSQRRSGRMGKKRIISLCAKRRIYKNSFLFRRKCKSTYPPSASGSFYICGCSRFMDLHLWITFPGKSQVVWHLHLFTFFSGKLSPVIMTGRKSVWFADIFLFLYNER